MKSNSFKTPYGINQTFKAVQAIILVMYTVVMLEGVRRQIFDGWYREYLFPHHIILYMFEICYFLFGYIILTRLIGQKHRWTVIFFSLCTSLMISVWYLYFGLKGAVSVEGMQLEAAFSIHAIVVWGVSMCMVALFKKAKTLKIYKQIFKNQEKQRI